MDNLVTIALIIVGGWVTISVLGFIAWAVIAKKFFDNF